jgi:deoxycytidylate deaminase
MRKEQKEMGSKEKWEKTRVAIFPCEACTAKALAIGIKLNAGSPIQAKFGRAWDDL